MRRFIASFLRGVTALSIVALGISLAALAALYWKSASYAQGVDELRVRSKEAYLEQVRAAGPSAARPPNVVLILFDDLGFGDIGVHGSDAIATPNIDRASSQGVSLTNYYAPAPVCSPSRAGLLTGRYPPRTGLVQVVMTPGGTHGAPLSSFPLYELQRAFGNVTHLPEEEITLAEVLSAAGYATGMFGKWHLGLVESALPNTRGFDTFHGLLSSNDQHPNPFYVDRKITEEDPVDQTTLTRRYTDGAIDFIESHRDEPFFVYLPHTFPHRPLHPSPEQRGRSLAGSYGDVVEDLDRSVGRILDCLEREGLANDTLVLITSDNGPWFQGSPGSTRGRKTDLFDGGFRVPFVAYWPGTLPAGEIRRQMAMGIDVFPTVLALAGIAMPEDRIIDGHDMTGLLRDGTPSTHEALYFYWTSVLGAVRAGDFKYHIRRPVLVGYALAPLAAQMDLGPLLFDLRTAPDESYDVSALHPETFAKLEMLLRSRAAADAIDPRGFSSGPSPFVDP